MNRRQLIKSIIGVAVATAIPAMPFVWREKSLAEIAAHVEMLTVTAHWLVSWGIRPPHSWLYNPLMDDYTAPKREIVAIQRATVFGFPLPNDLAHLSPQSIS
jgi:hypothetical protein